MAELSLPARISLSCNAFLRLQLRDGMTLAVTPSIAAPAAHTAGEPVEPAAFRHAMRHLAGAVSAITIGRGDDRTGFTATSVSSLAADTPSVIVSINRSSSSWPAVERYGSFCVNILAEDQAAVADNFAGRGGIKGNDRYLGSEWRELVTGAPALVDALVVLDCVLEEAISRHSHAILIGRVQAVSIRPEAKPLLYWHGAYRQLSDHTG